jgi:hypothetical protein
LFKILDYVGHHPLTRSTDFGRHCALIPVIAAR